MARKKKTQPEPTKGEKEEVPKEVLYFSASDEFGGTFSFTYHYPPVLAELKKLVALRFSSFDEQIDSIIKERNLTPDEAQDLKIRRSKQIEVATKVYTQIVVADFENSLPRKLIDALSEHMSETLARSFYNWDGVPFEDSKGELLKFTDNHSKLFKSVLEQIQRRARRRMNTPRHGGRRKPKTPKPLDSVDDQLTFALKVEELNKPFRRRLSLWEYIIQLMELEDYDSDCLKSLKENAALTHVPFDLIKEAFQSRKGYYESGSRIPRKFSPEAFTLKHACRALDFRDVGYETLRKRNAEAQKRVKAIRERDSSSTTLAE